MFNPATPQGMMNIVLLDAALIEQDSRPPELFENPTEVDLWVGILLLVAALVCYWKLK